MDSLLKIQNYPIIKFIYHSFKHNVLDFSAYVINNLKEDDDNCGQIFWETAHIVIQLLRFAFCFITKNRWKYLLVFLNMAAAAVTV